MQRIAILGCSGGGKSTLARDLSQRLSLPLVHLDALHWLPGWIERDDAAFRALQAQAVAGDRWVIDGNYTQTLDLRLPRADTILILDRSRLLCLWRVTWRWLTHLGRTRADMGEGCPEKVDWAFVQFIWSYPRRVAPRRDAAIARYGAHAAIYRLTSDAAIRRFIAEAARPGPSSPSADREEVGQRGQAPG
jgi:adenylate kinase family enzyme